MAASFTPLQPSLGIVHVDLGLVCSCSDMETHFMKLLTNSSGAEVASRGSLELSSECCNWRFLCTTCFSTRQSRSVSLCGLLFCGWAIVDPRLIHITITALTVDRGSSSRTEIWMERRHPMMVPRWKSLSSSVRPFYCQCLSMEIERLFAQFYTPVSNRCGWNNVVYILFHATVYTKVCEPFGITLISA